MTVHLSPLMFHKTPKRGCSVFCGYRCWLVENKQLWHISKLHTKKCNFGNRLLCSIFIPQAVWCSSVINSVRFHCLSQRLARALIVFSLFSDGDGYQDHLLPVCEDTACQHSAIYLAKSSSLEVHIAHIDKAIMFCAFLICNQFFNSTYFYFIHTSLTLSTLPSHFHRPPICELIQLVVLPARAIVNTV